MCKGRWAKSLISLGGIVGTHNNHAPSSWLVLPKTIPQSFARSSQMPAPFTQGGLYAAGGLYYAFTCYARSRGLCPHMKNPRFYRGVPFLGCYGSFGSAQDDNRGALETIRRVGTCSRLHGQHHAAAQSLRSRITNRSPQLSRGTASAATMFT